MEDWLRYNKFSARRNQEALSRMTGLPNASTQGLSTCEAKCRLSTKGLFKRIMACGTVFRMRARLYFIVMLMEYIYWAQARISKVRSSSKMRSKKLKIYQYKVVTQIVVSPAKNINYLGLLE